MTALRLSGVLSLVGAMGGHEVRFDVWPLMQPVTLTGYSAESLDGHSLRRPVAALTRWMASVILTAPSRRLMPLGEAAAPHALLEGRGVKGRVLLCARTPENNDPTPV